MRFKLLICLFLFTCTLVSGQSDSITVPAQTDTASLRPEKKSPQTIRHVIKTNPLPMLWGPIIFTSEFRIIQELTTGPYQSMQVGISLLRKSPVMSLFEDTLLKGTNDRYVVKGWRFQFAHRFFIPNMGMGYAPLGVYVSPTFSFSRATISTELAIRQGYYLTATHYNLGVVTGVQGLVMDGFTVDIFGGLAYQNKIWNEIDEQNNKFRNLDLSEVGLRDRNVKLLLGFNIGFCN